MSTTSTCTCSSSSRHSRSSYEDGSSWSASLSCSDLTAHQSEIDLSQWDFERQIDPNDGSLSLIKLDITSNHDPNQMCQSPECEGEKGGQSRWSSWVAKREKKKKKAAKPSNSTGVQEEDLAAMKTSPLSPLQSVSSMQSVSPLQSVSSLKSVSVLDQLIQSRNVILDLFKPANSELPQVGDEFIVMYINSESIRNENETGCFQFPQNGSEVGNMFSKLRGMLLTLVQVVKDTVHEEPSNSTIELDVGGTAPVRFEISYKVYNHGTLVVGVRGSDREVSCSDLNEIVETAINFTFGSLTACFSNETNATRLNRTLTLLHRTLFEGSNRLDLHPTFIQRLVTEDDELDLSISEVLTEYETMDWVEEINCENQEEVVSSCLNFIVVASCLFLNGRLVSSHFDSHNQFLVNTYFLSTNLVDISKSWDCKILLFHQVHLEDESHARYWLMAIGIGHAVFISIFQVPFTNWSIDIVIESILLKESLKFIQSNLINSGLIDDVDRIIHKQESLFQSSFDRMIHQRRESSSFLGAKSRSFRNLLSSNFSRSSFLTPDSMANRAHSTPSLAQSNVFSVSQTVSTESNSSSLSIHNFLRSEQNSNLGTSNFTLYLKLDLVTRTFFSPIFNVSAFSSDEMFQELLSKFKKICAELEMQSVSEESVIESGQVMMIGKECNPLPVYVTRERNGNEILYCARLSEIFSSSQRNVSFFDRVFL